MRLTKPDVVVRKDIGDELSKLQSSAGLSTKIPAHTNHLHVDNCYLNLGGIGPAAAIALRSKSELMAVLRVIGHFGWRRPHLHRGPQPYVK